MAHKSFLLFQRLITENFDLLPYREQWATNRCFNRKFISLNWKLRLVGIFKLTFYWTSWVQLLKESTLQKLLITITLFMQWNVRCRWRRLNLTTNLNCISVINIVLRPVHLTSISGLFKRAICRIKHNFRIFVDTWHIQLPLSSI